MGLRRAIAKAASRSGASITQKPAMTSLVSGEQPVRLSESCSGGVAGQSGSGVPALSLYCLESVEHDIEAGGESLVAVVGPDVLAEGREHGEAVGWQRPEEGVQLVPGRGVLDALLVDGGAIAE